MENKKGFILFQNYREYFEDLTGEETKELLFAIFDYEKTRVKPSNLSTKVGCYFLVIKQQLDKQYQEYINISNKNKENISKRWNKEKQKDTKDTKNTSGKSGINGIPNILDNDIDIDKDIDIDINNKKENNIKEKSSQTKQPSAIIPVKVSKKSPQQRIYDYFADRYQAMTGLKYLSKRSEFINLTDLIHKNGEELVKQKIQWLEIGCLNNVFWFSKNINSFTIGNLVRNWNEIMPIKTEEQKKADAEKKKEEERMKRVLAEAQRLREERSK